MANFDALGSGPQSGGSAWLCPMCGELESQCRCDGDDKLCWVCHCEPCQCRHDDDEECEWQDEFVANDYE